MIKPWMTILRKAAEEHSYVLSQHALTRMIERNVTDEDVQRCGLTGNLLETEDHGEDIKVLVQGVDAQGDGFFMVVALTFPEKPTIVTVCRFREEAWEDVGPLKRRR